MSVLHKAHEIVVVMVSHVELTSCVLGICIHRCVAEAAAQLKNPIKSTDQEHLQKHFRLSSE